MMTGGYGERSKPEKDGSADASRSDAYGVMRSSARSNFR